MARFLLAMILLWLTAGNAAAECRSLTEGDEFYTVCEFDPAVTRLELFNLDDTGEPLADFATLAAKLASEGRKLSFAMNAGMYGEDLKPIGLYVENGEQAKRLNRRNGSGNFHLKPNGVFYLAEGKAAVVETELYAKLKLKPDFATQSGPMLVIDGKLHPKFSATGVSEKIRNGVGVKDDGTVVFAISDTAVNFHSFASLFRDTLGCQNALFLDGSISSLYAPELGRSGGLAPLGPMVGAVEIQ
jgi:uncharacterized protein YigE (DUF2233 family)